ncbi:MAG: hypothetical protein MRY74_11740 [Neomegalonema sp.]|nr:hypothetical protein [Neomegalonema sp.]
MMQGLFQILIWPGDKICALIGQNPKDDSGMLRGFVNNVFYGGVAALLILLL